MRKVPAGAPRARRVTISYLACRSRDGAGFGSARSSRGGLLQRLVQRIYDTGFDTLVWAFRYFLLGAVIVFPVWLVLRILKLGRRDAQRF